MGNVGWLLHVDPSLKSLISVMLQLAVQDKMRTKRSCVIKFIHAEKLHTLTFIDACQMFPEKCMRVGLVSRYCVSTMSHVAYISNKSLNVKALENASAMKANKSEKSHSLTDNLPCKNIFLAACTGVISIEIT